MPLSVIEDTQMAFSAKGQTTLEYLLIVILVIAVASIVLRFTQQSRESAIGTASNMLESTIYYAPPVLTGSIEALADIAGNGVIYTTAPVDGSLIGLYVHINPCYKIIDVQSPCSYAASYNCLIVEGKVGSYNATTFRIYRTLQQCVDSEKMSGCKSNADCTTDEFCEFPLCPDTPTFVAQTGQCVAIPDYCPTLYAPVCGCDGKTYPNDCVRKIAAVSKRREGACNLTLVNGVCGNAINTCLAGIFEDLPDNGTYSVWRCLGLNGGTNASCSLSGCKSNNDCAAEQFCEFPVCSDDPTFAAQVGQCIDIPQICPTLYEPVCGCDSKTYQNDCVRKMSSVSMRHDGPCAVTPGAGKCGAAARTYSAGEPFPGGEFCDNGVVSPVPSPPPVGSMTSWACEGEDGNNVICIAKREA